MKEESLQYGNTLILLQGGHSSLIKGITVSEVEDAVSDALEEGLKFLYLQPENYEDNGICIRPEKVVAIVSTGRP